LGNLGNNDCGVAYEVFVMDYYDDRGRIAPEDMKLVVDLGANVGFSLLYFLYKYRHCRIIAFEPHPYHFKQAERNLALNGGSGRVQLYAQAAGASNRRMQLSDEGAGSSLVEDTVSGEISVDVFDIFPLLMGRRIDLLKMDIEGGEYEILGDRRFGELSIAAIVMEWHARGNGIDDKKWCQTRLLRLGYEIEEIFNEPKSGMFWARR